MAVERVRRDEIAPVEAAGDGACDLRGPHRPDVDDIEVAVDVGRKQVELVGLDHADAGRIATYAADDSLLRTVRQVRAVDHQTPRAAAFASAVGRAASAPAAFSAPAVVLSPYAFGLDIGVVEPAVAGQRSRSAPTADPCRP